MRGKEKMNLMNRKWDFLIILDACRYDYFRKVYKRYLSGTLKKTRSVATNTRTWCKENFKNRYDDIVYISANPLVNSKVKVGDFNAKEKFHKIIDVWDWGWSEESGTVPPEKVNAAVKKTITDFPNKRLIIHYIQPHFPYLSLKNMEGYRSLRDELKLNMKMRKFGRLRDFLGMVFVRILSNEIMWRIKKSIGIPKGGLMYFVWRKLGRKGIQQGYEENLRIVLKNVSKVLQHLDGRVIISSDHGELLGENGYYGHPWWRHDRTLVEIPWFEVRPRNM